MMEFEAFSEFVRQTRARVDETEFRAMVQHEAEECISQHARRKPSGARHLQYGDAMNMATERMIAWWQSASEYRQSPAHLIGTTRPACAWCVLTWREKQESAPCR